MDFIVNSLGFGMGGGGPRLTCQSESIPFPTTLPGAEFLAVEAHVVANYSISTPLGFSVSDYPSGTPRQTFCNITVTHTHPGQNDSIHTYIWLPLPVAGDDPAVVAGVPWNGVLQSVGGASFQTGHWVWAHAAAVSEGYAAVSTDGGHATENFGDPASWALVSEGNVDLYALQNFATVALRDAAVIGKSVAADFYGRPPRRAYYTGCSTGGRQAAMLAQRWPELYDGYLSGAPGLYWDQLLVAALYPHAVMAELGGYVPPACEMREFSRRALRHCDGLDGVEDGVISEPDLCAASFDPRALAGEEFVCDDEGAGGKTMKLTEQGAQVSKAVWEGWYDEETGGGGREGERGGTRTLVWPGLGHQSTMEGHFNWLRTTCDFATEPPRCKSAGFEPAVRWLQYFVYRTHRPVDPATLTVAGLQRALRWSRQWYASTLGTSDADLAELRGSGAKLLMWHGLADEGIPAAQTRTYYESVAARDPARVDDYLRFFEAPGVGHCGFGGFGFRPQGLVETLRAWVEEGKAPEVLPARMVTAPPLAGAKSGGGGVVMERMLCKYPKRAKYDGKGDITKAESFRCQ